MDPSPELTRPKVTGVEATRPRDSRRLPLSALLSQALVAFTIEFDNEFEHRFRTARPHRDALASKHEGPWLVSQVMWANVMRLLPEEGLTVEELHSRAHTAQDSLAGLQRWGYLTRDRPRESGPPDQDLVRPTSAGRRAPEAPLGGVIEQRWRERFGASAIAPLRAALAAPIAARQSELPHYLPIVHPAQHARAEVLAARRSEPARLGAEEEVDLSVLLAQALLTFTLDFERESRISLAISANTLRVLAAEPCGLGELPRRTGISREATTIVVGFLERVDCAVLEALPSPARGLTEKGGRAQAKYRRLLRETEAGWVHEFGQCAITS